MSDLHAPLMTASAGRSSSNNAFWNEATGATSALGANAVLIGASRDCGVSSGTLHGRGFFNAFVLTDQSGTVYIDCSNDGTTWYVGASAAITPATPLILTMPVMTEFHRARVVNGPTPETYLWVNDAYSAG